MPKKSWYIKETELDDYQVKVIQRRSDNSFVVKGCAGSGKSILALWKAKQIQENKMGSYYVIVFTRALKQFFEDGIKSIGLNSARVTYHWKWKNDGFPTADYIIVDEAQDFEKSDIETMKNSAKKALILYGDTAQQMYKEFRPGVLSMEQIITLTGFPDEKLVFNHRLPKKIARIAEKISKYPDDLENRCTEEGVELPKILEYSNLTEQFDAIINIIKSNSFEDVGILFRLNEDVQKAFDYFTRKGLTVEARYSKNDGKTNVMSLNFESSNPKLMTYHSAKGLQFEAVFIPNCVAEEEDSRNPLYVAITRTYNSLFVMHSGNLSSFFDSIPSNLYETTLIKEPTKRL